jgi:NADH-quinone oxidoreductase subunit M
MTMIALYMSMIDPVETAIHFGLMKPGDILTNELIFEIQQLLASGSIPAEQIVHTFSIPYLSNESNLIPYSILSFESSSSLWGIPMRNWGFFAILLGFLIKLPAAPLHTWLPDAHVEAPTAVSVVLAGLLLKVGAYGMFRIVLPVFPEMMVQYAFPLSVLGLASIYYGAFNALGSSDLKKLVAYSSVSHMGYVVLGLFALTAEGLTGAMYQTLSHGFISPLLFILVGVLYDRVHNRNRDHFNGLVQQMPVYITLFMLAFFASMGIPGFSGFIAEVMVLIGAFKSSGFNQIIPRWVALLATGGLFLSASYCLFTARKVFFGSFWVQENMDAHALKDLKTREYLMIFLLLGFIILMGLYPAFVLQYLNPVVSQFTLMVEGK